MTTITVELDDDLAADLEAEARGRGTTPAKLLIEFAAESIAPRDLPEPPPEVMAEVRRRQETPLSECRPMKETIADLKAKIEAWAAELPESDGSRREGGRP